MKTIAKRWQRVILCALRNKKGWQRWIWCILLSPDRFSLCWSWQICVEYPLKHLSDGILSELDPTSFLSDYTTVPTGKQQTNMLRTQSHTNKSLTSQVLLVPAKTWCGPSLITRRKPFPKESTGILQHFPSSLSTQAEQGWWKAVALECKGVQLFLGLVPYLKYRARESTSQSVWNRVWAPVLGDVMMDTLTTVFLGTPESSHAVWWHKADCKTKTTPRCKFFSWRNYGLRKLKMGTEISLIGDKFFRMQ